MTKLLGTNIANASLNSVGINLAGRGRLYTQKRKFDRTHKIYGHFSTLEANTLMREIAARGGRNVRTVPAIVGRGIAGVRFEVAV